MSPIFCCFLQQTGSRNGFNENNPQCNAVTNRKCSLCSPKLETATQSFSEECGEEHHSLGIQNPAIDQKSLHVCAEVLMCIAACVYYCVIGFVSSQGTQWLLKSYCGFLCFQEQINDRTCTDSTPYYFRIKMGQAGQVGRTITYVKDIQ